VDSGQLLLCDPCYIDAQWKKVEFDVEAAFDENTMAGRDFNYNGCSSVSRLYEEEDGCQLIFALGHAGAGVCVSSGVGDGVYPVLAELIDDPVWGTRVKKVWVDFWGEEE